MIGRQKMYTEQEVYELTKTLHNQMSEIQSYVALELRTIQRKAQHILSVCEANDNKPAVIFKEANDINFISNNIATDLEKDTKN